MATGTASPIELGGNLQSGVNTNHSKIDNTRNVRAYRQGIKNCNDYYMYDNKCSKLETEKG